MIRDGATNATLKHIASSPSKVLAVNHYTDVQTQGRNIRCYAKYLTERARAYAKTKHDFVGGSPGRLKKLSVDKGLLRETEILQDQIAALLQCDMFTDEPENEISLTAFRTLTMDLLVLFQAMNEGTINVLEHYFEMSKPDAERAVIIYRSFAKQTDLVVRFLSMARQYEYVTRLEIPKIKHAPTNLGNALEDYLNDKDFEINRRQYLAQQEARGGKSSGTSRLFGDSKPSSSEAAFPEPKPAVSQPAQASQAPSTRGPAPDLIDFFSSIEDRQQSMAQSTGQFSQQPQYPQQPQMMSQPTGFQPQTNPFAQAQQQHQQQPFQHIPQQTGFDQFQPQVQTFQPPAQPQPPPQQPQQLQPQSTGFGFGGYTPQPPQQPPMPQQQQPQQTGFQQFAPAPQPGFPQQQQQHMAPQQTTNPFRQSMMPQPPGQAGPGFGGPPSLAPTPTGHNPFAPNQQQPQVPSFQQHAPQQLMPQPTGTNPFARASPPSQPNAASPMLATPTGSTNPFRQSQFVNQQTGQGWQHQQGTMGGLEQLPTNNVFPRPGQPPQQQGSPWG